MGNKISVPQECCEAPRGLIQCERALSEVQPWPTQAITKMTNCFPRPGFSPLEARLRLAVPTSLRPGSFGRGAWGAEPPSL